MTCLACCTRLVLSAHPDKRQEAVMLTLVERHHGKAGRATVSESVRQSLEKRR
jgi:hypothetical protein